MTANLQPFLPSQPLLWLPFDRQIAGSANKKGGVYDRLCDQKSYTGVYAERFKGEGGRINGDTVNDGVAFSGNTNSGGDHAVRDLSQ